jgi:hypothetical protein
LAREDSRWYEAQTDLTHLFAKAGHDFCGDSQRCFRGDVSACRTGATGGQYEVAADVVDQFDQSLFERTSYTPLDIASVTVTDAISSTRFTMW